jgi:hypothetical protein
VYSVSVCDHCLLPRDEWLEIKSQTRIRILPPLICALQFVWCSQIHGQALVKYSGRTLHSTAIHSSALQFIISTLYYNVVPWMSFEHLNRVATRCLILKLVALQFHTHAHICIYVCDMLVLIHLHHTYTMYSASRKFQANAGAGGCRDRIIQLR